MVDKAIRDKELQEEGADKILDISLANFNKRNNSNVGMDTVRVRCIYDCDCTVVGGTDPLPPAGTATGVVSYGVGDMTG